MFFSFPLFTKKIDTFIYLFTKNNQNTTKTNKNRNFFKQNTKNRLLKNLKNVKLYFALYFTTLFFLHVSIGTYCSIKRVSKTEKMDYTESVNVSLIQSNYFLGQIFEQIYFTCFFAQYRPTDFYSSYNKQLLNYTPTVFLTKLSHFNPFSICTRLYILPLLLNPQLMLLLKFA